MKDISRQEGIKKMLRYINDNEVFWSDEMRDNLDIQGDPYYYRKNNYTWNPYCTFRDLINELLQKKFLIASDKKGNTRQYMRIVVYIEYESVKLAKGRDLTIKEKTITKKY